MDLLPSVDLLRDHLVAHDRAVREIIALDQYIEQLTAQTFMSATGDCMNSTFQKMVRISVAEGLKRMYKEYRLLKWLKVQEMAKTVRQVLAAEVGPDPGLLPQSNQDQLEPVHNNQLLQQEHNLSLHNLMPVPDIQNWHPPMSNQQLESPVTGPPLISPIQTPTRSDMTIFGRRQLTGTTPEEFHQFAIDNISVGSEGHLTSRQLFQDPTHLVSLDFAAPSEIRDTRVDIHHSMIIIGEQVHESVPTHLSGSSIPHPVLNGNVILDNTSENQSVRYPIIHQEQQLTDNGHLDDPDEEMDWDSDDSSYDDSEDSLAGVLFAAEHVLPEEQAVRLDVEMGDMGIGHMVFDRVSATWFMSHCEFYRAG